MVEQKLRIGETYRYGRPYRAEDKYCDGYRNYFNITRTIGQNLATLDRGINAIAEIKTKEGKRR